ncbi:hypothetical protein M9Y10_045036 [Tritrichomonas musculus]|uniref:Uncharacterized protein n=1 Tax=Tritrichomonas musculus TaxID=1915356 RepID=A0ABR2JU47_9EUKA
MSGFDEKMKRHHQMRLNTELGLELDENELDFDNILGPESISRDAIRRTKEPTPLEGLIPFYDIDYSSPSRK